MSSGKTAAASVGAAAMLGLPAVAAGIGSADAEAPPLKTPDAAKRTSARPPSYSELEQRLRAAVADVRYWRRKARRHWRLVYRLRSAVGHSFDPVRTGLLCIHGGEGSWTDHGAPYWGGLQMDTAFMRTYGLPLVQRFGTADRWPAGAQLAVGELAYYSGRGFGPWPVTRRACGL